MIAVILVYDAAGNVIETHKHKGEFNSYRLCKRPIKNGLVVKLCPALRVCHRGGMPGGVPG